MSDDLFHGALLDVNRTVRSSGIPGELAEFDGWMVADSGTRIDGLNQALVLEVPRAVRSLESVEQWFRARGTGFQLVLRIPGDEVVFELAKARGYAQTRSQPLMAALMPLSSYPLAAGVTAAIVRDAEDIRNYLSVRESGPGRPPHDEEAKVIAALVATGKLHYFVAMDDGVPIATASSAVSGAVVSISNVWVAETARKRGLGTAMTAIAAASHREAEWAILEASAMGDPVYRRMGFEERFRYVRLAPPQASAVS